MPLPETSEGFARLLRELVPSDAARIEAAGISGYAWKGRGGPGSAGLLDLPVFACVDARGRASTGIHYGSRDCDAYAGFMPWPLLRDLGLSGLRSPDAPRGPGPDGIAAFADRFCAGIDYQALRLVAEADAADPDAYAWLVSGGDEGPRRRAFAAAYPWALDALVESGQDLWDDTDTDAAVDLVRSSSPSGAGPARTLRRLVEATRGHGLHELDRRTALRAMRAASFLPYGWIPEDRVELTHLLALAPHLLAHAARSGRLLSEAGRPGEGWAPMVTRLLSKAGLLAHPAPLQSKLSGLSVLVEDRLDAFVEQVLLPAAESLRASPAPDELLKAAHRLLVGTRSHAASIEAALRWQARRTPAAEAIAGMATRAGLSWEEAFPVRRDRLGVEAACLTTPAELVEEGRALGHCVARYLPACLAGERVIVSIRRPARDGMPAERLSTMEFSPVQGGLALQQHRGHGNASPPDVAVLSGRRLCEALAVDRGARTAARPGTGAAREALRRLYRDNPEECRSLWASALGPDLASASPERLLASAGIETSPTLPGPG
jgi:hypothetical protein